MPLSSSLVSYWKLDEASNSTTWLDASGTNHLTAGGPPTISVAGKINTAASFPSGAHNYLAIASNTSLQMGGSDFTITAWVNLNSRGLAQSVAGKWTGVGNAKEYFLGYDANQSTFNLSISTNGSDQPTVYSSTFGIPNTGQWYFLAAQHDHTGFTLKISVNAGAQDSAATGFAVRSGTTAFRIGEKVDGSNCDLLIDEVGLWKRLLTLQEITQLYNSGNGLPFPWDAGAPPLPLIQYGIPIRSVPWLKRRVVPVPVRIAASPPPPPPPQSYRLVGKPRLPIRSVPWVEFRPAVPTPREDPPPRPGSRQFAPVLIERPGPPIPNVPWRIPFSLPPFTVGIVIQAPVPGVQTYPPQITSAPPILGVPWVRSFLAPSPSSLAPAQPSPPPVPPVPPTHAGSAKPFVERVPDAEQRLRRHTEKVSDIFNSLLEQGIVVQAGPKEYTLDVTGLEGASGITGSFSSGSFGSG